MKKSTMGAGLGAGVIGLLLAGCVAIIHPAGEYEQRLAAGANRPPDPGKGLPNISKAAPIDQVLRCAILGNPEIRTAFNEWVAALERVPQAGALEDPMISLSVDAQYVLGFDPMRRLGLQRPGQMRMKPEGGDWMSMRTMEDGGSGRLLDALGLGFEQAVPGAGKREARAERALLEAQATGLRFLNAERKLRRETLSAYAELLHNRRRIEVEEQNVDLLKEIQDITLRSLGVGVGSEADVLKAEFAIAEAETELRSARIEEPRLRARLNALLGRRADATVGELSGVEAEWKRKKAAMLLEIACQANPELSALQTEVQARGADVLLAELQYNPDFTFGTSLRMMEQMLMAGLSLPIYTERIEAQIREAAANHAASQTRYTSAVYDAMARLIGALASLEDAERISEDYGSRLVPKLREIVEVQLRTYGAGEGAFLDILDTRRSFIQSERLLIRAESERLQALSQLEEVAGVNLLRLKPVPYVRRQISIEGSGSAETTNSLDMEMLIELPPMEERTATQPSVEPTTGTLGFPAVISPSVVLSTPSATKAVPPTLPGEPVLPTPAPILPPLPTPQPVRMDSGTTIGAVQNPGDLLRGPKALSL